MKEGYCVLDKSVICQILNDKSLNAIILVHGDDEMSRTVVEDYDAIARKINLSYRHRKTTSTQSECVRTTTSKSDRPNYIFCRIMKSDFPVTLSTNDVSSITVTIVLSKGGDKLIAMNDNNKIPGLRDILTFAAKHFNEQRLMPIIVPMDKEMDKRRKESDYKFVYYYRESEPVVPIMHNLEISEPFTNAFIGCSEATWQLLRRPQLMAKGIAIDLDKISPDSDGSGFPIDIRFPCIFDMETNREYAFQDAIDWIMRQSSE